jgi:hypothetical protein
MRERLKSMELLQGEERDVLIVKAHQRLKELNEGIEALRKEVNSLKVVLEALSEKVKGLSDERE